MPGRSEDKIGQCYKEASQHCHIGSHQLVLAMMNLYAGTIFFHLSHCMNEHFKIKISFLNLIFFSFSRKLQQIDILDCLARSILTFQMRLKKYQKTQSLRCRERERERERESMMREKERERRESKKDQVWNHQQRQIAKTNLPNKKVKILITHTTCFTRII